VQRLYRRDGSRDALWSVRHGEVVLVTDGYHAFRVGALAEALGLHASVSPTETRLSTGAELRQIARETMAVSVGRVIGWNRLFRLDAAVND
jgi:uncharacterized SAM-binding protein YcdF (DUF218 family)